MRPLKQNDADRSHFGNTKLRLQSAVVVIPTAFGLPGLRQENTEDSGVIGSVNGVEPALAAISIPSAAYVGWIKKMIPEYGQPDYARISVTRQRNWTVLTGFPRNSTPPTWCRMLRPCVRERRRRIMTLS